MLTSCSWIPNRSSAWKPLTVRAARRRRDGGQFAWLTTPLGGEGVVRGVVVGTSHFKGNYPASCAVDVCDRPGTLAADDLRRADWHEILPRTPLDGDARNELAV